MTSTVVFVFMIIFAAILLLVASIYSTLAAEFIFASTTYNNDARARSAHQYLTIAAALGWSAIVVLVVILVTAAAAGGFTNIEVSEAFLAKNNPTEKDVVTALETERELSSGNTMQVIVIVVLIIIAVVTLVVGILATIAAIQIGDMGMRDDSSIQAYANSIVAAATAIGGVGIMSIAIVSYYTIRSARQKQLEDIQEFERRAQIIHKP